MGFEKSIRLVKDTLKDPDIIIRERIDPNVYIYYKCYKKFYYICVVVKHLNNEGYIITAYITDRLKRGEKIYEKNKGLLR